LAAIVKAGNAADFMRGKGGSDLNPGSDSITDRELILSQCEGRWRGAEMLDPPSKIDSGDLMLEPGCRWSMDRHWPTLAGGPRAD
jgi:hypothetical protein